LRKQLDFEQTPQAEGQPPKPKVGIPSGFVYPCKGYFNHGQHEDVHLNIYI